MKKYRIKDVSDLLGISTYTLRYHEKIGLLKFVKRDENGVREFEPDDLMTLCTIIYLRKTGMPLKDIKDYLHLAEKGIDTIDQRKEMFLKQKQKVQEEMTTLEKSMEVIDRKLNFYSEASKKHSMNVCQDEREKWLKDILAGKEKVQ